MNDASFFIVLRDIIRAFEDALLTAEALIFKVFDNARLFIFHIGFGGAACHARRLGAVMTGGRDMLDGRILAGSPVDQSDRPPGFIFVQTVLVVTGADAGLAAGAFIQIHLKGILLTRPGCFSGDQFTVFFLRWLELTQIMHQREFLNGANQGIPIDVIFHQWFFHKEKVV